jgi:hypothetical protein
MIGHIYMIIAEQSRAVKIGTSRYRVSARMDTIQTHNHEKLALLRTFPGDSTLEAQFHFYFWPHHIRGEWFQFVDEMLTVSPETVASHAAEKNAATSPHWLRNKYAGWAFGEREYQSWFAVSSGERAS